MGGNQRAPSKRALRDDLGWWCPILCNRSAARPQNSCSISRQHKNTRNDACASLLVWKTSCHSGGTSSCCCPAERLRRSRLCPRADLWQRSFSTSGQVPARRAESCGWESRSLRGPGLCSRRPRARAAPPRILVRAAARRRGRQRLAPGPAPRAAVVLPSPPRPFSICHFRVRIYRPLLILIYHLIFFN